MASLFDEEEIISERGERAALNAQYDLVKHWLGNNLPWEQFEHTFHGHTEHEIPMTSYLHFTHNERSEVWKYAEIELLIKDNIIYINPLEDSPIKIVGEFIGDIPNYIKFTRPVRLHVIKDRRLNQDNDVVGDNWIASIYYSDEIKKRYS